MNYPADQKPNTENEWRAELHQTRSFFVQLQAMQEETPWMQARGAYLTGYGDGQGWDPDEPPAPEPPAEDGPQAAEEREEAAPPIAQ